MQYNAIQSSCIGLCVVRLQVLLCMAVVPVLAAHLVASLHLLQDDLYNCSRLACNTQSGS